MNQYTDLCDIFGLDFGTLIDMCGDVKRTITSITNSTKEKEVNNKSSYTNNLLGTTSNIIADAQAWRKNLSK